MMLYEEKLELYRDYSRELVPTSNFTDEDLYAECDEYINSEDIKWINIFDSDNTELIGFLLIGKSGATAALGSDYSIVDSYIVPEYRNQGYMTKAATEYIQNHEGTYSFVILHTNELGKQFWPNLFTKCGYEPVELVDRYGDWRHKFMSLFGYKKG